jgi:signal transduction histidine kinase
VVGARTAAVLADRAARDVDELRAGLDAIAAGDLGRRVEPRGPDELVGLAHSANAMAARLEQGREELAAADRSRRELVAAVSHDLRTPLAALRLLVEGVQDGVISGEREIAAALDAVGTHVRALSSLVDDLFEIARLDAGEIAWSPQRVAVDELLGETVEAFRPQAERKGLRLGRVVAGGVGGVSASPERLQRVLHNLVQNALRHTPADGSVTLRAEPAEQRFVLIEVADTGAGIAEADRERAFERFYRGGEEAARPLGGAGLGLSICRAIVEAHGGRIWIEPAEPHGTRVRFTVPAAS